jgi:hypothetical protein
MRILVTVALALLGALMPTAATAERAAGITGSNSLVTFDTLSPGTGAVKPITGLGASERVLALDTRPATGELMALTAPIGVAANATIRIYHVDPNRARRRR